MRRIVVEALVAVMLSVLVLGCAPRASSTPAAPATSPQAATPSPASQATELAVASPSAMAQPTRTAAPPASVRATRTATPRAAATPALTPVTAPTPVPATSIFGVQMTQVTPGDELDLALDAGPHWVRFLALEWDKIEPVRTDPPTYHWDAVDEASLREAAQRGLEVIALVQFTPEWAQAIAGVVCGPIKEQAFPDFARFLRAAVDRYGAPPFHVRYWELGNEPDVDPAFVPARSVFGCWGDLADEYYGGRAYAQMLKVAYPAIKSEDPDAVVLNGGLLLDRPSGGNDTHPHFLEGLLEAGGGDYFDILSFHAYSYYVRPGVMGSASWPGSATVMPAKVAFIRDLLQRYGHGDKPLMNTESALLCAEAVPECLEAQAAHATRSYAEALVLGLAAQIHYAWINEHWRHTGLVLLDLTPKPSYHGFKAAASFLGGASYRSPATGYPGIEGYVFAQALSARLLEVLWSADGQPHELILPAGSSAFDYLGQTLATGGAAVVVRDPIYVVREEATTP